MTRSKITEVTRYKTSDGLEFASKADAEVHERLNSMAAGAFVPIFDTYTGNRTNFDDFNSWATENIDWLTEYMDILT